MTDNVTQELMLEHIKRIETDLSKMRRELREAIAAAAEDRAHTLALMGTTARHEDRFTDLAARMERIERRLDPTD